MSKLVICLTTVGEKREAERIARHLVKKKLVACVQLLPGLISFYPWEKKLCRGSEILLLMKTTKAQVSALEKELLKIHPYELPEFVVFPIASGSKKYLDWILQNVKS